VYIACNRWLQSMEGGGNAPNITVNVTPDALPESFRFVLAEPGDVAAVKARLQSEPGVQQVVAGLPAAR
jgi:hypothetical protein